MNTCVQKFHIWMKIQALKKKRYFTYAHNGGCYDHYFSRVCMKPRDHDDKPPFIKGRTMIQMENTEIY